MRKYIWWKPVKAILCAVVTILIASAVTQTAFAQVTDFKIVSAVVPRPSEMVVTVQAYFSLTSPEGRFVRVSILDSENRVLDTQKQDWPSGSTVTNTFEFTDLPFKYGEVYKVQADAYCPNYKHHFQQVTVKGEIRVFVNGIQLTLDVPPILWEGRTLVPVRGVFESMGGKVSWDEAKKEVTVTKDKLVLVIPIDKKSVLKDGKEVILDVPAQIVDGRTLVPLRFISEALGATLEWDGIEYAVRIFTGTGGTVEPY